MDKKIMLIDDDKDFLEELKESLVLNDYEVVTVNEPSLTMETAAREKPDVIITDIKMPGESGFQLACKLKFFSSLSNIPIIAMTGYFKEEYIPFMKAYGIISYIKKPFDTIDIISKIEGAS
jgi:DNA-binding response OmpR family regulator